MCITIDDAASHWSGSVVAESAGPGFLDALAAALRSGSSLRWQTDCFVLRTPDEAEVARGVRLDELALVLNAGEGRAPKSPWVTVKLKRNLLLQVARVRNVGESLSGFLRESMRREIAARLALESAEIEQVTHVA